MLQFSFDIGEQAYIDGTPLRNGADVLNQLTATANTLSSATYDINSHKIQVSLSVATVGGTVTLKDAITDQAGNKIIATTAIVKSGFIVEKQ